jgi:SnoaL-like domain
MFKSPITRPRRCGDSTRRFSVTNLTRSRNWSRKTASSRTRSPRSNGSRHVGRQACLAVWQGLAGDSGTHFEPEEVFVAGDRAIIRWRYFWGAGESNSVRGVNLMRVRGGQIIEAMGYVKSSG